MPLGRGEDKDAPGKRTLNLKTLSVHSQARDPGRHQLPRRLPQLILPQFRCLSWRRQDPETNHSPGRSRQGEGYFPVPSPPRPTWTRLQRVTLTRLLLFIYFLSPTCGGICSCILALIRPAPNDACLGAVKVQPRRPNSSWTQKSARVPRTPQSLCPQSTRTDVRSTLRVETYGPGGRRAFPPAMGRRRQSAPAASGARKRRGPGPREARGARPGLRVLKTLVLVVAAAPVLMSVSPRRGPWLGKSAPGAGSGQGERGTLWG